MLVAGYWLSCYGMMTVGFLFTINNDGIYNADDNLMMFDGSAGEYYGIYNDDDKLIDDG